MPPPFTISYAPYVVPSSGVPKTPSHDQRIRTEFSLSFLSQFKFIIWASTVVAVKDLGFCTEEAYEDAALSAS